jgi:FkbM family methyltransferase
LKRWQSTMAGVLHRRLVAAIQAIMPNNWTDRLRQAIRERRARRDKQLRIQREIWWTAQAGSGGVIARVDRGVKMRLHCDSALCRQIYLDSFEPTERHFTKAFLKRGDVYVDVGANLGLFTLIAARLVGPIGHVYALEPSNQTFQRLEENVSLNRFTNVTACQLALSDSERAMEMVTSKEGLDAWNSFASPYVGTKFSRENVDATAWDSFAIEHNLSGRVSLMKIDVEGWELKVLEGAKQQLSRDDAPVLQVEFTDAAAEAAGSSCRRVYHFLQELGYELCRFCSESGRLVPDAIRESYPYCNLFAVKNRQAAQDRLDASVKAR